MTDSPHQFELQPDLGIEHVADLQAALAGQLQLDAPLELAGGQVRRVHAAGLQLLHAFVRERARAGRHTLVTNPSTALADAVRLLALEDSLLGTGTRTTLQESTTGEPA